MSSSGECSDYLCLRVRCVCMLCIVMSWSKINILGIYFLMSFILTTYSYKKNNDEWQRFSEKWHIWTVWPCVSESSCVYVRTVCANDSNEIKSVLCGMLSILRVRMCAAYKSFAKLCTEFFYLSMSAAIWLEQTLIKYLFIKCTLFFAFYLFKFKRTKRKI